MLHGADLVEKLLIIKDLIITKLELNCRAVTQSVKILTRKI